jgi:hypothetical protein
LLKKTTIVLDPISTTAILIFADLLSAVTKSLNILKKYKGLKWTTIDYMHKSLASKRYFKTGYAAAVNIGDSPHAAYFKYKGSIEIEHPNENIYACFSRCLCDREG